MKISYAICVCNESRELYSLISFLKKVKDQEDEINILVDSAHVTPQVRSVLEFFKENIVQNDRDFDGKFATHRNYHIEKCVGDYIFIIDPDEMPHEFLIKNIKKVITDSGSDAISLCRINICPGFTEEWIKKSGLPINDMGWINWPDYTTRIIKNNSKIKFSYELHEKISGTEKPLCVEAQPSTALWHIKSIEKQENRWEEKDGDWLYTMPTTANGNLYDKLM